MDRLDSILANLRLTLLPFIDSLSFRAFLLKKGFRYASHGSQDFVSLTTGSYCPSEWGTSCGIDSVEH